MQTKKKTNHDIPEGTESEQKIISKAGKTQAAYWKSRLRKRTFSRGRDTIEIPDWQIRLKHAGGDGWFNLHTQDADAAAKQARDIYVFLLANGWEATNAKFKPKPKEFPDSPTLGEFFVAVKKNVRMTDRTFAAYCRKFRTIVADMFDIKASEKEKFSHKGSGIWRERVEKVKLADITPKKVELWRNAFIARAGHDPRKIREAEHSADSGIRCARALFGKKILPQLANFPFPKPLPFAGVSVKQLNNPYRSNIEPGDLMRDALAELRPFEPDAFKIFLLCMMGGLRRNEADKLLWSSFNWRKGTVSIEANEFFTGKNLSSEAVIPMAPKVMEMLSALKPADGLGFVINSKLKAKRNATTYTHYRANAHFLTLIDWLRKKNVKGKFPIHTLRKECGRMVTEAHGIYAAQRQLRHRDVTTTARYYADDRRATYPEFPDISQPNQKKPEVSSPQQENKTPDSQTKTQGAAA
jgi:integrase